MDPKFIEELRQKYIKNPLEGMTARLVKNMISSDLLDMHYFLTEDDDLDEVKFEEGFYIFWCLHLVSVPTFGGLFFFKVLPHWEKFPNSQKNRSVLTIWAIFLLGELFYIPNL